MTTNRCISRQALQAETLKLLIVLSSNWAIMESTIIHLRE